MVAVDTFMYLYEQVIGVFLSYALKDGCRKASFIKGPSMDGESSRPRSELGGLLRIAWKGSVHQVILDRVHPARLEHYQGHLFNVDVHRGLWEVLDRYQSV